MLCHGPVCGPLLAEEDSQSILQSVLSTVAIQSMQTATAPLQPPPGFAPLVRGV